MTEDDLKSLINDLKSSTLQGLSSGAERTQKYKFSAHERLFRLILNVSTLSLTAWIAIAAWGFESFEYNGHLVYWGCGLFLLSLVLNVICDLIIMQQSRIEEVYYNRISSKIINVFMNLNINLGSMRMLKKPINEQFEAYVEYIKKEYSDLDEDKVDKINFYSKWSWIIGLGAVITFFMAIGFSIYAIIEYVHVALKIKNLIKS